MGYTPFSYPLSISTNTDLPQFGLHINGEFISQPFFSHGLIEEVDPELTYGLPFEQATQLTQMNRELQDMADRMAGESVVTIEQRVLERANAMLHIYRKACGQ